MPVAGKDRPFIQALPKAEGLDKDRGDMTGLLPEYSRSLRSMVCPIKWCFKQLEQAGDENNPILFCRKCGLACEQIAGQWVEFKNFKPPNS
jgi:hypothetical protein